MSLYLWINVLSVSVPLIVSFHPSIKLYERWKFLFPALFIVLVPFIVWDVYFTESGFWGFNDRYLSGVYLLSLPIEEWLFFITVPYACVFTHVAILKINPKLQLKSTTVQRISKVLLVIFVLTAVRNYSQSYTLVVMLFGLFVLIAVMIFHARLLQTFYVTFLLMLVPFFIVNGILTGTGIDQEVVWYSDAENMGIRILTIPIEDTVYAFSLILLNLFLFEMLERKFAGEKGTAL